MSHQHFPKLILLSATIQSLSAGSQCPLHQQSPHRMPAPRGLLNLATIVFVTGEKSHVWWRHACYNWWSMIHGWTCSWNVHEQIMVKTWMNMDGHGWTWMDMFMEKLASTTAQAEKSLLWRPVRAHPGPGPKRFRRPRGSRRRMMYPFITCRMQKWKLIRSANLKCFNVEMPIPAVAYCSDVVAMAWFPDGSIVIISTIQHYNHYSCFSV